MENNIFGIGKKKDPLTGLDIPDSSQELIDPTEVDQQDIDTISSIGQAAPRQEDLVLPQSEIDLAAQPMEEQIPVEKAPPLSREASLLEELRNIRESSDKELKSAKSADRWLSLANSLNAALGKFDQATAMKATLTPNIKAIEPGVVASTSSAKDILAERSAKINELLTQQKIAQLLSPKQASALDLAKIKESEAKAKMYEAKSKDRPIQDKETIKEEIKIRTENRKEKKQLESDIQNTEKLLKNLEDTKKQFENYSKTSPGGTGPIAGRIKILDTKTEALDSRFKEQNLDTMSKLFQGMSKAVDSEAERRAFESAQPSIYNDDENNQQILERRINASKELLKKQKQKFSSIDKKGNLIEQEEEPVQSKATTKESTQERQAPDGEIVERNGKRYKWNPSVGKYQLI